MDVHWLSAEGIERHHVEDLKPLLARNGGFVWVDIPICDEQATRVLTEVFGFHPLAVRDCQERSHVPKVHAYPDYVFVTLHAPEPQETGHVEFLELNQFVGRHYLVTVHEPPGAGVPLDAALRETRAAAQQSGDVIALATAWSFVALGR